MILGHVYKVVFSNDLWHKTLHVLSYSNTGDDVLVLAREAAATRFPKDRTADWPLMSVAKVTDCYSNE